MNVVSNLSTITQVSVSDDPVVVVGGGPVGLRTAQELSRRGLRVVLFNAERWRPYNRVKLTPLLAGEAQIGQVYLPDRFPGPGNVARYDGVSVVDIDRARREVSTSTGRRAGYSQLVLALGSRAFVPGIPGARLSGVFTFRNFNDAEALLARSMTARRVAVIGGGLLGLEAARGMSRRGAHVTVIEHENRLMPRQLDEAAGELLCRRIQEFGVGVITGDRVKEIIGDARVDGLALGSGEFLPCDTVIVCTGVRANTQLAAAAGLKFGRGILVNDQMQTSDPRIYAVGECAEHAGIVHGLVGPGFEQAACAVASIAGEDRPYRGSTPGTKLKVLGADVFSIGDFERSAQQPNIRSWSFQDKNTGAYRRIFADRGRMVAALAVGDWPEATRVQQAVTRGETVWPWAGWRFRRAGMLWHDSGEGVGGWPREAIVCNCTGVTKGAIVDAITLGSASLEEVRSSTGANSVCGSCKTEVLSLLGQGNRKPEPAKWWKWLLALSSAATLAAVAILLMPRIALSESFRVGELLRSLWFDSVWKQYSGFTLLGLTVAAAVLGLRKRIPVFARLGGYEGWRLMHLVFGLVAALGLVWHTGFRLGSNLNLLLMASFLATLLFGSIAGLATGGEHELRERGLAGAKSRAKNLPLWAHIIALWPLPALVLIHVLTVYMF